MSASNPRLQGTALGYAEGERSLEESGPEAPADAFVRTTPVTRERFSTAFDRSFERVYAYVSQRVRVRESCERIVRAVLVANLDVLLNGGDETHELCQLTAASDRLIGLESARIRNESPTPSADAGEGAGDNACRVLLRSPSG